MNIEQIISIPVQSISYLENKIKSVYKHFKLKAYHKRPLMTTEQYEFIYPYIADMLYQELTLISDEIYHEEFEINGIKLNGFTIFEHRIAKLYTFIFTYEGNWLCDYEPIEIPIHIQEYINKLVCNSRECLIYNKPLTKENIDMENIERLQMEIGGIELPYEELLVFMEEEGINGDDIYNASSRANKKAIYASAWSVLNSIANQPHLMRNYKQDDMTIMDFSKYLQKRIDQLEKKIRQMPSEDSTPSNFFNLFK
ncbi:TPA: glutathionylspermidine synthase [Bacillus cereus]|uniref:glutathionylspermidine synthase n=1 Tax=Bacillus cereus TaxID=1396 RepID=UPI000C28151E|nr:glutathionylspermidine synthase [Bacillus cereus]BCC07183.1 hypothetical protein BCM0060_3446 [Bacillus cereus]HDR8245790.1 glutathionylspermidine synthase [Bacillus cereus]HDR8256326.1 glutathionylspermidine synthase [Bacillus cereus]HDR8304823.1 glutathionylspermidine synthase [Bacillus cereus]HDR8479627.1 glutathionylspermidine synthase [Bacillus cereus]